MGYKQEFGMGFDLGFKEYQFPYELHDRSYRNDCCPSFWFKKGNDFYILWVDFEEPEEREFESAKRYTLVHAINEGENDSPEIYSDTDKAIITESESFPSITSIV